MKQYVMMVALFVCSNFLNAQASEWFITLRAMKERHDAAWLDLRSKHERARNDLRKQKYAEWAKFDKEFYKLLENGQYLVPVERKFIDLIRKQSKDEKVLNERCNEEINRLQERQDDEIELTFGHIVQREISRD